MKNRSLANLALLFGVFWQKMFVDIKKCSIFALALKQGLVVQLVRIHACHAWGRGFESRPD
ncbi:MAG: hypothetical protein RLY43_1637, partial [Bacteroidota bacterium]